jgi:hypothetical protein
MAWELHKVLPGDQHSSLVVGLDHPASPRGHLAHHSGSSAVNIAVEAVRHTYSTL